MKPLKEALIDYNLAELQAIAAKRGASEPQNQKRETISALADELLSPALMEITLQDLSAEETEALQSLVAAGGVVEARKFARIYGAIRNMGANQLQREKPWEKPVNPAESLWFRGLIFKGFHHTVHGPEEVVFIPTDVQQTLPFSAPKTPITRWEIATDPTVVLPTTATAREDVFCLLVYLQNRFVRLPSDDTIPANHRLAIRQTFSMPGAADDTSAAKHWFEFILHLARRMDFLRLQGRRLKLHTDTVRNWLKAPAHRQLSALQQTWRTDPTWNDLWHVPGLKPKPTGWENSPMLGRSRILLHLSRVPVGEWLSIDGFVRAIKTAEPDFQRPDGDYESWYIYDEADTPLMGFDHWDDVEGRLIRHLLTVTLPALGTVMLGAPAESSPATVFKISPLGDNFLHPETSPVTETHASAAIRINPTNFSMRVPHTVSLYHRFQLARFAAQEKRTGRATEYRITRESFRRAQEQSITVEQILGFLKRVTNTQVPLPLVDTLHRWEKHTASAKIEQLTVLRVADASTLTELMQHPEIGKLLGPPLGPTAALVPEKNLATVKKLLLQDGYLAED